LKVGHDVTFALKIVNNGPDAATHVTIEVVPDTDLTILDADASGGTCFDLRPRVATLLDRSYDS
jgi:uncharacterized repeat protein (TIGR01451 family)